ncbi:cupin domain-containing protein [Enterovirga rhinocerotis]|uniref:Transcriptional regulator n=1 Tax=Enterovirga rhinocerotis TaxID=1339210 RepID=A0A4R7BZL9_9HYPH|nr:cupin domain-containing protein [Enterovirga rhinocerotis]TDR90215.1 transcriptional regulator [Enterovirga rhinocerotis]
MSSIQIIKGSAQIALPEDRGHVAKPISQPPCSLSGQSLDLGAISQRAGLWECSPGSFRRDVKEGEVMHMLSGTCTFKPDSGDEIRIGAGDTVFFPPNTGGVWTVETTIRKVYVIVG